MAEHRMFSQEIVETDKFLNMPATAQNLYFYLNLHADDEGFVGNPRAIKRMIGASDDDYKLLIANRLIMPLNEGLYMSEEVSKWGKIIR